MCESFDVDRNLVANNLLTCNINGKKNNRVSFHVKMYYTYLCIFHILNKATKFQKASLLFHKSLSYYFETTSMVCFDLLYLHVVLELL